MTTKSKRAKRTVLTDTAADVEFIPADQPREIPPEPAQDPMLGDKTPAYVEWLRDYAPAEFSRRYAGRRTHLGVHPR